MKDKSLKTRYKQYICRPYCMYYKENQKEEFMCRGAQIITELIINKKITVHSIPQQKKNPILWETNDPDLKDYVCIFCDFYEQDCDFQSPDPPSDCEPCGGYILLKILLNNGLITINDLKGIKKIETL